jgi:hypothetical protein
METAIVTIDGTHKFSTSELLEKYELVRCMCDAFKQDKDENSEQKTSVIEIKIDCSSSFFMLASAICDNRKPSIKRQELNKIIKVLDYLGSDVTITTDLRRLLFDDNKIFNQDGTLRKLTSKYVNVIDLYLWEYTSNMKNLSYEYEYSYDNYGNWDNNNPIIAWDIISDRTQATCCTCDNADCTCECNFMCECVCVCNTSEECECECECWLEHFFTCGTRLVLVSYNNCHFNEEDRAIFGNGSVVNFSELDDVRKYIEKYQTLTTLY